LPGLCLRLQNSKSQAEQQRMLKEAEFSFKQLTPSVRTAGSALPLHQPPHCMGRVDDARMMATTSLKLDPNNAQVEGLALELNA